MTTNIREIEKGDYDKGHLELYKQLTHINPENISRSMYNNFVEKLNESHMIFVLVHNDSIVGSGTIIIEDKLIRDISRVGHIEDIVVDGNCRGSGYGKKIIEYLIEYSKKMGCYKVILDCSNSNQEFYEKCGLTLNGCQMCKYF